ncbi:ABC transporter ATP-binding protein, partial [bacterium]|nr:ABC transporter ATP-binding protein [bacterium]
LQPGVYFLNAGVLGIVDGSEVFLHRIIDCSMFRVQSEENLLSTSMVDFCAEPIVSIQYQ